MNILLYTKEETELVKFTSYIETTYQFTPVLNETFDWAGVTNQSDRVTIYTIPDSIFNITEIRTTMGSTRVSAIEGDSYVKTTFHITPVIALDKTQIIANGIDEVTITNCPTGVFTATNISTNEEISGAISGFDTFSTTIVGTYNITIECEGYETFTTTIEAI